MPQTAYSLDDIKSLFLTNGAERYGAEAINQLQHALQCGHLAEQAGSSNELIAAAFLHDVGHLAHDLGEDCAERGVDDAHEHRAIRILDGLFSTEVINPIAMHVEAKRCLCAIDEGYHATLSPASVRSMELQGPTFTPDEVQEFMARPQSAEALDLRRWDDLAKDPDAETPDFDHFWDIITGLAQK